MNACRRCVVAIIVTNKHREWRRSLSDTNPHATNVLTSSADHGISKKSVSQEFFKWYLLRIPFHRRIDSELVLFFATCKVAQSYQIKFFNIYKSTPLSGGRAAWHWSHIEPWKYKFSLSKVEAGEMKDDRQAPFHMRLCCVIRKFT